MQSRTVLLQEGAITYELQHSHRARQMRLYVSHRGFVRLTLPRHIDALRADLFVREKSRWILKHIKQYRQSKHRLVPPTESKRRYTLHKHRALQLAEARLQHFNHYYQLPYGTVSIRNQQQRWGSCSPANNLSFNYRIALIPPRLADYVIVHELCHVRFHHHGPAFWKLVAKTIADYQTHRRELRTEHRISYY